MLSRDKAWVYYRLNRVLCQDDLIYIMPEIHGVKPDFLIIRPNYGIIVIDVFEHKVEELELEESSKNEEQRDVLK